jgi:Holliday junction DNA helicase RuvA
MIDYIKGQLVYLDLHYVVVEASGIGYQIHMANPFQLQHMDNQEVIVYTYQHVREDILALYGFLTREERGLYEKLLQVSGIGPKAALAILSAGSPGQIIVAIQSEDLTFLTRLPGIGKKTAQRIVLDLKDKLDEVAARFANDVLFAQTSVTSQPSRTSVRAVSGSLKEALEGLQSLGYSEKEIDRIVPELRKEAGEDWSTDRFIKLGLQLLMK